MTHDGPEHGSVEEAAERLISLAEAILILIQRHTWGALVVGQDVAVALGVILIGNDVVLKELDLLSPLEDCHLTLRILEL